MRKGSFAGSDFVIDEFLARERTLMRRTTPSRTAAAGGRDVVLDTNSHEVRKAGRPVSLAPREFALLEHLLHNRGVVRDRVTILEQVWGESDDLLFSQTVDVHVEPADPAHRSAEAASGSAPGPGAREVRRPKTRVRDKPVA